MLLAKQICSKMVSKRSVIYKRIRVSCKIKFLWPNSMTTKTCIFLIIRTPFCFCIFICIYPWYYITSLIQFSVSLSFESFSICTKICCESQFWKKKSSFVINFECLPNFIYLPIRVVSPQRRVRWNTSTSTCTCRLLWSTDITLFHEKSIWIFGILFVIGTNTKVLLFRT